MSTVSTQGYSNVGYKPKISRLCKYCEQVQVVLSYEPIHSYYNGETRFRWICRNANTGSIHNCIDRSSY